ncbi:MAG TPA: hypothetical protein VFY23_16820 [Candidatus Limnocylindrales bacterium]|nr:hypothetical protein [Candidatus Limnocylindrales bacterium]
MSDPPAPVPPPPHAPVASPPSRWSPAAVLPRLPGLLVGLLLFGSGIAFMAEAGMGLGPWEVFHQGIAMQTGLQLGTVSILLGIPILAAWYPLGERPGVGTVLNILLIGTATNVALGVIPDISGQPQQLLLMALGVVTIAAGSGLYLASDLGPGPRDGLMTGLHFRFGWSIRRARTAVELTVLCLGFLAGGTIGLGTVVFALGIGPLVQVMLRIFDRDGRVSRRRRAMLEARGVVGD